MKNFICNIFCNICCNIFVWLLMAMSMSSCGDTSSFKLSGEVSGGANTNLYLKYYSGDAIRTAVTAARDGKFDGEFALPSSAVVYVLDNEGTILGRMYAEGGDNLSITIDRSNPAKSAVSGSDINERWTKVMNDNAEVLTTSNPKEVNAFIDKYIADNPKDIVGALIFAEFYDSSVDPVHAAEVLEKMDKDARRPEILGSYISQLSRFAMAESYGEIAPFEYRVAEKDSAVLFTPRGEKASLIVISNESSRRPDSIVAPLKDIYKTLPKTKARILDLALYARADAFERGVRRDSAQWHQGWIPGALLGEGIYNLAIPRIPYFIVADTAGMQIYRGESIDEAKKVMEKYVEGI